jgi:hypothetical protein
MKVVIFVLCYDAASQHEASKVYGGLPWARVTRIPTTMYMEGVMYWMWLDQFRHVWHDADFVGTLSWNASTKLVIPDMEQLGRQADQLGAGVVAVHSSRDDLVGQATKCHPRFMEVWVTLLEEMGYTREDATSRQIPAFFCNYWMARPPLMERYVAWFRRARILLDTCAAIQEPLWSDSGYPGRLRGQRCMAIWARPYYPHHCFVVERLPCFFFWKSGIEVHLVSPVPPAAPAPAPRPASRVVIPPHIQMLLDRRRAARS